MRHFIISWILACFAAGYASAHGGSAIAIELRQLTNGTYICSVMAPLHTLDDAMRNDRDFGNVSKIGTPDYKRQLVAYLRDRIDITPYSVAVGEIGLATAPLELGQAGIKLGGHQTNIIFEVLDFPRFEPVVLDVHLPLSVHDPKQQNLVQYISNGRRHRLILDNKTNFMGRLGVWARPLVCRYGWQGDGACRQ